MYTAIAQILPNSILKNINYSDLYFLSATPPLLSFFRKISMDFYLYISIYINLILFFYSSIVLYKSFNKQYIGLIASVIYLIYPASYIFNFYEIDTGLFVSLSILLFSELKKIKSNNKSTLISILLICLYSFLLSILSSKWTPFYVFFIAIYLYFSVNSKYKLLYLTIILAFNFALPVKNYIYDGIFSNSTWAGLNLGLVTQNIRINDMSEYPIYGFYVDAKIVEKVEGCQNLENLFVEDIYGCKYLKLSQNDLKNSLNRIKINPLNFLELGFINFKNEFLKFPDSYDNSGMSNKKLKYDTSSLFNILLNVILFYIFVLLMLSKNYFSVLCFFCIITHLILINYINGIEQGRMKFYYFGLILINLDIIISRIYLIYNFLKNKYFLIFFKN
jgi:hypothetical protein